MQKIAQSLYYTFETNIVLYVNCSLIKKKDSPKTSIDGFTIIFGLIFKNCLNSIGIYIAIIWS